MCTGPLSALCHGGRDTFAPARTTYDADNPAEARELKAAIARSDAVLFVTPEYIRSLPGALKNAIDWASRPWGQNSFTTSRPG